MQNRTCGQLYLFSPSLGLENISPLIHTYDMRPGPDPALSRHLLSLRFIFILNPLSIQATCLLCGPGCELLRGRCWLTISCSFPEPIQCRAINGYSATTCGINWKSLSTSNPPSLAGESERRLIVISYNLSLIIKE